MNRKREFWKGKDEIFLETSIVDLKNGCESFENILKAKLEKENISLRKLSTSEIYKKMDFPKILKITEQVNSYISQAKQKSWNPKILAEKIAKLSENKDFLPFANIIFEKYEKSKKIDFLDLLELAIKNMSETDVSKLKYLLIDEFQDFSPLFYKLISQIVKL